MRYCLEIAGKLGLLALVFLIVVLLAVGIGAVTVGDAGEHGGSVASRTRPAAELPGATVVPVEIQARGEDETPGEPGSTSLPTTHTHELGPGRRGPERSLVDALRAPAAGDRAAAPGTGRAPLVGAEQHQAAGRPGAERGRAGPLRDPAATVRTARRRVRRRSWRCSNTRSSATSCPSSSCCSACT